MEELSEKLRLTATENPDVTVLKEHVWKLPVVLYDVKISRVKRLKMDILMKMLLFAFQERDIRRAATLADMLFVEELFISDSIDKMERTRLIGLDKKGYALTAKGHDYLEKGIFEEEMEPEAAQIVYSAAHDDYDLPKDSEVQEAEESLEPYRYAVKGAVKKERIQKLLADRPPESDEQGFQIIATDITSCIEHSVAHVPCIEFQLYDRKQDIFYARVWNTASASWDEKLEKAIEAREVVAWRRAMEKQAK